MQTGKTPTSAVTRRPAATTSRRIRKASKTLPAVADLCASAIGDSVTVERRAAAYAWLDMGQALGVSYEDNEELKGSDKVIERDKHRWELDPASADDFEKNRE